MRIGTNPNKSVSQGESKYTHQVIIPIYIPNEEDYFKDGLKILELCLQSLINTSHHKTFITVVNNGCCNEVIAYLDKILLEKKIHELIHTDNIGKINAVFKGISGNNIELVTVADADVMFLSNWQVETQKIFSKIHKAGVVGLTPQFKTYRANCGNIIFDNLFNPNLKFLPVKNKEAIIHFYDSIGWDRNYNQDYLEYTLGLVKDDVKCLLGSGHFVATYKKNMFEQMLTFIGGKKAAGIGEMYLDTKPLEKDYYRLTTYDNYAYHMGNVYEKWMDNIPVKVDFTENILSNFPKNKKINTVSYFIKNRVFIKFIKLKFTHHLFLKFKKLPKEMIDRY